MTTQSARFSVSGFSFIWVNNEPRSLPATGHHLMQLANFYKQDKTNSQYKEQTITIKRFCLQWVGVVMMNSGLLSLHFATTPPPARWVPLFESFESKLFCSVAESKKLGHRWSTISSDKERQRMPTKTLFEYLYSLKLTQTKVWLIFICQLHQPTCFWPV